MPAFIRLCDETEIAPVGCPGCVCLAPMIVRDVEPHSGLARVDFIYECSDCGAEVRHTIRRPFSHH